MAVPVVRQVIQNASATVTLAIPLGLRNQSIEVIVIPWHLEDQTTVTSGNGQTMADPDIVDFFGCLPDFPERAAQGEYEMRELLE